MKIEIQLLRLSSEDRELAASTQLGHPGKTCKTVWPAYDEGLIPHPELRFPWALQATGSLVLTEDCHLEVCLPADPGERLEVTGAPVEV